MTQRNPILVRTTWAACLLGSLALVAIASGAETDADPVEPVRVVPDAASAAQAFISLLDEDARGRRSMHWRTRSASTGTSSPGHGTACRYGT